MISTRWLATSSSSSNRAIKQVAGRYSLLCITQGKDVCDWPLKCEYWYCNW
jgi:hypothetical protein